MGLRGDSHNDDRAIKRRAVRASVGSVMPLRIAILGAGAMGKLFGARLALAGNAVTLIDVDPVIIAAIRAEGVCLEADDGVFPVRMPIGAAAEFHDVVDVLLVFTKAQHSAAAAQAARHLVGTDTGVLTLQNGLGGGERLAAILPAAYIAVGTTTWPADATAPARVHTHGRGGVRFWSLLGEQRPILQRLDAAFCAAGLASRLDPQVEVTIWEKAIFNAVMNPVAALTRLTVGVMAAHPDGRALADSILAEAFRVAAAANVPIDEGRVRATVAIAFSEHGPHRPSMLEDVIAGRKTEIDAINGALVQRAQSAGVPVPVLETLARLVRMAT